MSLLSIVLCTALGCVEQIDLRSPLEDVESIEHPDAAALDAPAEDARQEDARSEDARDSEDASLPDHHEDSLDSGAHPDATESDAGNGDGDATTEDAHEEMPACIVQGHECVENVDRPGQCPEGRETFMLRCGNEMLACCGPL